MLSCSSEKKSENCEKLINNSEAEFWEKLQITLFFGEFRKKSEF